MLKCTPNLKNRCPLSHITNAIYVFSEDLCICRHEGVKMCLKIASSATVSRGMFRRGSFLLFVLLHHLCLSLAGWLPANRFRGWWGAEHWAHFFFVQKGGEIENFCSTCTTLHKSREFSCFAENFSFVLLELYRESNIIYWFVILKNDILLLRILKY